MILDWREIQNIWGDHGHGWRVTSYEIERERGNKRVVLVVLIKNRGQVVEKGEFIILFHKRCEGWKDDNRLYLSYDIKDDIVKIYVKYNHLKGGEKK